MTRKTKSPNKTDSVIARSVEPRSVTGARLASVRGGMGINRIVVTSGEIKAGTGS